jgi:hypothetical protein
VHARFSDHAGSGGTLALARPPMWPSAQQTASAPGTKFSFAAQWLAYTYPCRRFADILTNVCARLGADADRYSFIAVDLHHLLLAGLPAHLLKNSKLQDRQI